jgi:FHA domain-containing protein
MEDEKLSGRVIIDTILANMRQQVEELRYSRVVPAAYDVYLHGDDQQRFESLAHEIAAEAVRALQERLDSLNRPSRLDRVRVMVRKPRLPFKKVGPWLVRITRDPEGAVPRGRALVVSQIALAGAESFEGQRTRRLATLSEPPDASLESREVPHSQTLAVLAWEDETGAHRFRMTGHETTVGRAVQGSTADVRLATLPDVSRVHVRLRYHAQGRRFSIEDLSQLGTTVNGQALVRGAPRDLPSAADIRLADAITVRFESEALS